MGWCEDFERERRLKDYDRLRRAEEISIAYGQRLFRHHFMEALTVDDPGSGPYSPDANRAVYNFADGQPLDGTVDLGTIMSKVDRAITTALAESTRAHREYLTYLASAQYDEDQAKEQRARDERAKQRQQAH